MDNETKEFLENMKAELKDDINSLQKETKEGFKASVKRHEELVGIVSTSFSGVQEQLNDIASDVTDLKRTVAGDHEARLRQLEEVEV